ncbi:transketolase [Pseudomonadota bacterium]
MKSDEQLKKMANAIRFLSIDAIEKAKSGHPGMPMGMADVATVLFSEYMSFDPHHPKWSNRDRFVLSAGHGSMLLYSLLYLTGYKDININDIKNFRQLSSKTAGHPEYGYLSGIETTTGPLGQGVANAVGMAVAERIMNAKFGDDFVEHNTYCIAGDGCLMEGVSYEACALAGHWNLNKLIILWDNNEITIDGSTNLATSENMKMRFEACGFEFIEIDGHNYNEIRRGLDKAKKSNKPSLISCKTKIGYGCPTKCGTNKVHGAALGTECVVETRKKLNWGHAPFEIFEDILKNWRECTKKGSEASNKWLDKVEKADEKLKTEFFRLVEGELPMDWRDMLRKLEQELFMEKPTEPTRKSSQRVLEVLTKNIPELIGGSADLSDSVMTQTSSMKKSFQKDSYDGKYIYYGVREHAMGAIMNGIALYGGFIPYAGTFFVFSDYMKPAIRMSALMKQHVIYVLTHDSIGLGEDGPTHQPIEHLASLRAIPNLNVFRPADAQETLECYEVALQDKKTPSAMILSRQKLPYLQEEYNKENYSAYGAYIFSDSAMGIEPDVVLMASGSEVQIALEVKKMLHNKGLAIRVVSVPCLELFDKQKASYKKSVLGAKKSLKIVIEAASEYGWHKYIGENGLFFGIKGGFGKSAPAKDLFEYFGLTPSKIYSEILRKLR